MSTPANALDITQAGLVKFDGSTTFTGVTVTNHDVLIGSTSNGITSVGPGTAGQVLQSGGASADPAYSTATYPATAGTNGNVLTSNGTNFVSSAPATSGTVTSVSGTANQVAVATGTTTPVISLIGPYTPATYAAHGVLVGEGTSSIAALATGSAGQVLQSGGAAADPAYSTPTYPSASGTSRTILVSDGTNNVYSTETWATPGANGNVLTSNGTNWTSAAAGSSPFTLISTTLTSAQIKALHGTPIQLVAAPGAGKVIALVGPSYVKFTYGGTNVFVAGASQSINYYYGTSSDAAGQAIIGNATITGTTSVINAKAPTFVSTALASIENLALNAYNPIATEITGNAGADNTVTLTFYYYTLTL